MTSPPDDGRDGPDRDDQTDPVGRDDRAERDDSLDVEARFADIVARFDDPPERPRPASPAPAGPEVDAAGPTGARHDGPGALAEQAAAAEDPEPTGADDRSVAEEERPDDRSQWSSWGASAALAGPPPLEPLVESAAERRARIEREVDQAVDGPDGGHYVPPEPEPLPRQDLPTRLALVAVLLGPVLLIVAAMVWRSIPEWAVGTIVVGIIAGFVVLVSRLPRSRDLDDPDDGARV